MAMELYDAFSDGKRTKVKSCELKKHVEGPKNIDPDYKRLLRSVFENFEVHEEHKNQKREREIVDYADHEGDDDSDGEIDPQYELFLGALKSHDKSYVIDGERNGAPVFIKYEAEISSEDELVHKSQRKVSNCVAEQIYEISKGKNKVLYQREKGGVVKEEKNSVNEDRTPEEISVQRRINLKEKNTVRKKNEAYTKGILKVDEKPNKIVGRRYKIFNGENEIKEVKTASGKYYSAKNQIDHNVKARSGRTAIHTKTRNVESFKCKDAYQKKHIRDGNYPGKKEGNDEIDSEVEILDINAFAGKGILHKCVPSKIFHYSDDDDNQHHGCSSRYDAFRKKVLSVLGKPFDEEEYKRLKEAVRDGSYLESYPDLGGNLKKYRHERGKCLNILRGFFFWLQNVSHEGVFKPWKDRECLAV